MLRDRWLVTGVAPRPTDGGTLRMHHIFRDLIRRTDAVSTPGGGGRAMLTALLRRPSHLRARLAAAHLLTPRGWEVLRHTVRPTVLDLHDHPVIHREALGFPLAAREGRRMEAVVASLVGSFAWTIVQTDAFGELAGVDRDRRIVIPNGTDTRHIRVEPPGSTPTVAMVSGAAPGRGIEALLGAVSAVRTSQPEVKLNLGLIPAGGLAASRGYLDSLRQRVAGSTWVTISEVPYERLSAFLGAAAVLVIPHPPHVYWDAIVPIKLFDCLAAGRPLVVTPRTETARVIREASAGVVSRSDAVDDFAAALLDVLGDARRAGEMGGNARRAAEERYDWRLLSRRVADAVLRPER